MEKQNKDICLDKDCNVSQVLNVPIIIEAVAGSGSELDIITLKVSSLLATLF